MSCWDLPNGDADIARVKRAAAAAGVRVGAINPNVFQDQDYKFGSFGNPHAEIRDRAVQHCLDSVRLARALDSRDVSLWFADGSNYPGTASVRDRKRWFADGLARVHAALDPSQRMLVEYKPFEPAFYHTDIADWGMALLHARAAGPQAKVLVDTGHHYLTQNIEQIVAWLLDEGMLGGFHFNDRRYADDDLTLGSIDPYQLFRIFHEIRFYEWQTGARADIAYMVDQSHNLKGKIEAMIQTVAMAQALYAKARWSTASGSWRRSGRPIWCAPRAVFRMRSRPTSAMRWACGGRAGACRSIPRKRFVKPVTSSALRKSARGARPQVLPHTPDPRSHKRLHLKDLSDRCGWCVRFALPNILSQQETF